MMAMRMRLPWQLAPRVSYVERAARGRWSTPAPPAREAGEGSLPGEQAAEAIRTPEHPSAARHAHWLHHEPVQQLAGGAAQRRTGGLHDSGRLRKEPLDDGQ